MGSEKFDIMMNSANVDKLGFSNLVKSLNIFHKPTNKFTTAEMKNSTLKKFPRYVKNKDGFVAPTQMHSSNVLNVDNTERNDMKKDMLKEYVDKFAKGQIDSKKFESILREKNINPNIEEISKHIRVSNSGNVNHKELLFSVMKYKNE